MSFWSTIYLLVCNTSKHIILQPKLTHLSHIVVVVPI